LYTGSGAIHPVEAGNINSAYFSRIGEMHVGNSCVRRCKGKQQDYVEIDRVSRSVSHVRSTAFGGGGRKRVVVPFWR